MENVVVKVWFEREGGADTIIRRFSLPQDIVSPYDFIHGKLTEVFSDLDIGLFHTYWKDKEEDLITFSSDEELTEALSSAMDSVLKIVVKGAKGSRKTGRVTAPDGIGRRFVGRRAKGKGLENKTTERIPPRFVNRWMRKSCDNWQREGVRLPVTEPANEQQTTPSNDMACLPACDGRRGRGFPKHRRMWQPDMFGQNRHGHSHHRGEPSMRLSTLSAEEKANMRQKRRQKKLQKLDQREANFEDCQSDFYPRWKSVKAGRDSECIDSMPSDQSRQRYHGLNGGCKRFHVHQEKTGRRQNQEGREARKTTTDLQHREEATCLEQSGESSGCSTSEKRGSWRRMKHTGVVSSAGDESFASCQRRRARRMRKEALMRIFGLPEPKFGPCDVHPKFTQRRVTFGDVTSNDLEATFPDNTPSGDYETQLAPSKINGCHGRRRRSAELYQHSPRISTTKVDQMKKCRGSGEKVFPAGNLRLCLKPRKGSDLSVYRLRVLRRLRRLKHLQSLAKATGQQTPMKGCTARRGAIQMFRQNDMLSPPGKSCSARKTVSRKPYHGFRRLRNNARCGRKKTRRPLATRNQMGIQFPLKSPFDNSNQNIRRRHLVKMLNKQANDYSLYPRRATRKRSIRHGHGQENCHPRIKHQCHKEFMTNGAPVETFRKAYPQTWRNADKLHLMKVLRQKPRRMNAIRGPVCGRATPWGSGFSRCPRRQSYNSPALMPRRRRMRLM